MKLTDPISKHIVRSMSSTWHRAQPFSADFKAFADTMLVPQLGIGGYKIAEKEDAARQALFNLVLAGLRDKAICMQRSSTKTPHHLLRTYDRIERAGFANMVPGSEFSGKVSRFIPTAKLLNSRQLWEQKLLRNAGPDSPPVVLTSGDVDPETGEDLPEETANRMLPLIPALVELAMRKYPDRDAVYLEAAALHRFLSWMEGCVDGINAENASHSWQVRVRRPDLSGNMIDTTKQPCVNLRQIHSGDLFRAMRLYTHGGPLGQNMKREVRATMRIDGEATYEIDYKCLHLSMLYHMRGLQPEGDLYRPEQIFPRFHAMNPPKQERDRVRDFLKIATLAALNAPTFGKAVNKVFYELEDAPWELRHIVMDIEGLKANTVLHRMAESHRDIDGEFFSGVGVQLMTIDGFFMLWALHILTSRGIPAFPVHDSIRVRCRDARATKDEMRAAYECRFGVSPRLSKE